MKKLIFNLICIFFLFSALLSSAQSSGKTISTWDFIETYLTNYSYTVSRYNDDIRIKLLGNYTSNDSVIVTQLVDDLKKLITSVNVELVKTNENLAITINEDSERTFLFDEGIRFGGGSSSTPINGVVLESRIKLNFRDSVDQRRRNKAIQYFLLRKLLPINELYIDTFSNERKKTEKQKNKINSDGIFSNSNYKKTSFNDFDKAILAEIYSKSFCIDFFRKNPLTFFKFARKNLFKYNYRTITNYQPSNFGLLALLLYMILVLKFYNFRKSSENWWKTCLNGIVLSIPLSILSIDEIFYLNSLYELIVPGFLSIYVLLIVFIIGCISASVYFFITRLLPINNIRIQSIYIFQFLSFIISGLIGIFMLNVCFQVADNYRNLLIAYILLFAVVEISINFLNDKSARKIKEKELQLAKMEKLKSKAELLAIQSRINPHFLYNSLNSIASLAISNPKKTREMAFALSEFCRFSLNKDNNDKVLLKDEIKMISSYLKIEQIRFEDKLNFSLDVNENIQNLFVPKFIIQPLIENAIKHVVSKTTDSCNIQLLIKEENNGLSINVIDDGPEFSETLIYGYGLQSIYDKLEILYSGEAKMDWSNKPIKKISVWIPIK